jgi:sugar lactone lactonase YvrE
VKKAAVAGAIVAAAVLSYLAAWPVAVDPVAWDSPAPRPWTPTGDFAAATRIELPDGAGPEDVDVDAAGRVYAGLDDGRILRWPPEGGARTLVFTDDLETTADGRVWFTDASVRYGQPEWKLDIAESRANGRLCVYDPATGVVTEVLRDLYFANGVAVDPVQQYVLVNETSRYRVRRVWIDGPRAGENDVFIDNLPGFPDGISTGSALYWIAVASPRNALLDGTSDSPRVRAAMMRLPEFLHPKPERTTRVIGVDREGRVAVDLFDPQGRTIAMVTSAQERDDTLYLGSLTDNAWARMPVPSAP